MSSIGISLRVFWQCLWGMPQTFIGCVLFLIYHKYPHYWYQGEIVTLWPKNSCVSLGLFIFLQEDDEELLLHEYGHTIQSLILGPLYLIIVGIPSAIWCNSKYFQRKRRKEHISYYAVFPESWSNRLIEKRTGRKLKL